MPPHPATHVKVRQPGNKLGGRHRSSSISVDRHHRLSLPRPSIGASSLSLSRSSFSTASVISDPWNRMPALGSGGLGRGGNSLMVPGRPGAGGRRSSCYPGSAMGLGPPSAPPRRHSSRSGSDIGFYNFIMTPKTTNSRVSFCAILAINFLLWKLEENERMETSSRMRLLCKRRHA